MRMMLATGTVFESVFTAPARKKTTFSPDLREDRDIVFVEVKS